MGWFKPLLGGRNKYSAKRTVLDGYTFASKAEASCYSMLKLMELAGEIKILSLQDKVYLTHAKILYKPDFKIMDLVANKVVWVEFKGKETASWGIKRRLWKFYGPGPLRVFKAQGSRIFLHEEIIP
jgi:hypothetical protein